MTDPRLPDRADIEAQITFEAAHGPKPSDRLTDADRRAIYQYNHIEAPLSPPAMQAYLDAHSPEDRAQAERERQLPWYAARWWYLQLSLEEARRLGYQSHPELSFLHNPIALIEQAQGREAGLALAQRWNFHPRTIDPGAMWYVMDQRRDGDAIVALIGDDRGYAPHWEYWIAVAWAPETLGQDLYDDPMFAPGLY